MISEHYPQFVRDQLVKAAKARDLALIDSITDELVRMGRCRPRDDGSKFFSRPDSQKRFEALMREAQAVA